MSTDTDQSSAETSAGAPDAPEESGVRYVWALLRLSIGFTFFWAFLDKTWGLDKATPSEAAWVNGGSPTTGYLENATRGPLGDVFDNLAGLVWADYLFMVGLFCIGGALMLGAGMRIAAGTGAAMLMFMWASALWPANNPFMDEHIIEALTLIGLAWVNAGDTFGIGGWWSRRSIVEKHPILR